MKKKLTAICLFAALCVPTAVFGEAVQVGDGQTVSVSGKTDEKNAPIAIEVYFGDKTAADLEGLTKDKYTDILVCHDQSVTDADGNYSFRFDINGKSGEYTVFLATDKTDLPKENLIFVSLEDYKKIAATIKKDDISKLKEYIENETYTIGLTKEDIAEIDTGKLAAVLHETIKTSTFDENKRSELLTVVHKALFVEKLNEGKITDIFAESSELTGLSGGALKDWYTKEYVTGDLKKDVNQRISGKSIASYAAYEELLTDSFILSTVRYPNGSGNIEDIMTAFAERIGINISSAKAGTWTKLAGESCADLPALKNAYKAALSAGTTISGGGGGGGKSTGSGSTNKEFNFLISGVPIAKDKSGEALPSASFSDIDGVEWAKDAILYLADNGILSGVGDGIFEPNRNVKREEFAKIVTLAFAYDADEAKISFTDIPSDAWYAPFIRQAFGEGIVNGISDDLFGVGLPITRQDLCTMAYNAALKAGKIIEIETPHELFADDDEISDYAKKAVYALRAAGVVSGITDDEFAPKENATRAQAAKIIYSILTDGEE